MHPARAAMLPLLLLVLWLAIPALATGSSTSGSQQPPMLDAAGFESKLTTSRSMLGLNSTCFKLCQLGKLPAGPMAADSTKPATAYNPALPPKEQAGNINLEAAGNAGEGVSWSPVLSKDQEMVPAEGISFVSAARQLLASMNTSSSSTTGNNTANSGGTPTVADATTACSPIDPAAQALLKQRYRGFKVNLAMSDFWELFYSLGNLWYAVNDLLKQGLSIQQSGQLQINAESILLFNQNLAGITAWWGNLVQNILLLSSDVLVPLPGES